MQFLVGFAKSGASRAQRSPGGVASTNSHCNRSAKTARSRSRADDQSETYMAVPGCLCAHPSLRQTRLNRYVRQNAQASMDPATTNMYGRSGCHRAIDTAPETPSNATVQGPMQHSPTMEANMLKPTAPPH